MIATPTLIKNANNPKSNNALLTAEKAILHLPAPLGKGAKGEMNDRRGERKDAGEDEGGEGEGRAGFSSRRRRSKIRFKERWIRSRVSWISEEESVGGVKLRRCVRGWSE